MLGKLNIPLPLVYVICPSVPANNAFTSVSKSVIWVCGIAICVVDALVNCPCWLTVNVPTPVALPYVPGVTAVLVTFISPELYVIPVLPDRYASTSDSTAL